MRARIESRNTLGMLFRIAAVGVALLAMLSCGDSGREPSASPTAPAGMFSTLPTNEAPALGDQAPTVELNTPEPTLTPQPTPTPNPTYTPVPTLTPLPTPTPDATGTPVPTPNPTGTPIPTPTTASENGVQNTPSDNALHRAVNDCNLELVRILVGAGANVNSRGAWPNENMPLHKAIPNCDSQMVQFLVNSSADVNALADWPNEDPPLHINSAQSHSTRTHYRR